MNGIYVWLDYHSNVRRKSKCEILRSRNKTVEIKLLEFGPHGTVPGTILKKVHKKNVIN